MSLLKVNVAWNCTTEEAKRWLVGMTLDVLREAPKDRLKDRIGQNFLETAIWELEGAVEHLETKAVDRIFEDAMKRLLE